MDFLEELCHAGHPYSKDPALYRRQKERERQYNHEYYIKNIQNKQKRANKPDALSILDQKDRDKIYSVVNSPALLKNVKTALLKRIEKEAPSIWSSDISDDAKCARYLYSVYGTKNPAALALYGAFVRRDLGSMAAQGGDKNEHNV